MIEDAGIYFPNVVPHCDPPRPPMAPPPGPNFTIQEQFLDTTRRVNETLNRVLRMESSFKATYEEFVKNLSADNVAFKDLCMVTYNQFAERVRTEVNTFEGDITNAYNAFAESVKQDISAQVAAADVLATSVDERITAFETAQTEALNAYKVELNSMLDASRDTTDARIAQYNANHEQAFTDYVTGMNARFADLEAKLEENQNDYTRETNADIANFKASVEGRLDGQNQTITDAVHYMKTNLQVYVGQIVDEMEETGELATVMGERMGIVTPEMYGAKGDGVTDDSEAIQAMINAAQPMGTVYFNNKTYAVAAGIVVDKKLNIDGRYCTLKAIANIPYVMTFTGQSSLVPAFIRDITVNGDSKATVGFEIGGNGDVTQLTFERCGATNTKLHGFHVSPVAYCVTFNRCRALYNGKDGFNAVGTAGNAQMNAIYFDGCTSQLNTEAGFYVNGMNIVLKECNSERNMNGVFVGGVNYPANAIVIRGGYYENNSAAQISVKALQFVDINITENYFFAPNNDGSAVMVKCEGAADMVRLYYDRNYSGTIGGTEVDGGESLDRDSFVSALTSSNTHLAKLGRVPANGERHYLPVTLSGGTAHTVGDPMTSVNMVNDATKNVYFMLPFATVNKVARFIGCTVNTDGTTAKLRISITIRDENGNQLMGTYFDKVLAENGLCFDNAMNNLGWYRIPANAFVEVAFILMESGNATSVTVSRPFIDLYG